VSPRGWIWWLVLVVPLWLVCALCTHWEPVLDDGWVAVKWHFNLDVSWSTLLEYQVDGWRAGNPRLGQTLTLLLFTPGPYHAIVTPVVELTMFGLLTTLGLGRWPSVRRADDALVAATLVALVAACTPQFGPMLFYRPFTGNYLFGFVLNLLWLVPYRLHAAQPRPGRPWLGPALLALGIAAGLCNEHTGIAFLGMAAAAGYQTVRSGHRIPLWMLAGAVGLLAGYIALLLAPGQALRYNSLAQQAGVLGRIAGRGLSGNLAVFGKLAFYLAPALLWLALGIAGRRAGRGAAVPEPAGSYRALGVLALGGLACTATLLASPKLGGRLHFAAIALIATALAGWVCSELRGRRLAIACAVLSAGTIAYAAVRCVTTYQAVAAIGADRLHQIHGAAWSRAALTVRRYPVGKGRWFLGDDFEGASLRENLAADYGLTSIDLAPALAPN
jgi:hypothetical protein